MIGYRKQDACRNCKHVRAIIDYDSPVELFCNVNQDEPPCPEGSRAAVKPPNNGYFDGPEWAAYHEKCNAWCKWADAHMVAHHGICEQHEPAKQAP